MLMRAERWACAVAVRNPEVLVLWFLGQCSSNFHLTLHRMLYFTTARDLMPLAPGSFLNLRILQVRVNGYWSLH